MRLVDCLNIRRIIHLQISSHVSADTDTFDKPFVFSLTHTFLETARFAGPIIIHIK